MSDNPERAIRIMRRQLELVCALDADVLEEIGEVSNDELEELPLDEDDVELLRSMGRPRREGFATTDPADARAILDMSDRVQLLGSSQYSDQRHEFLLRRNLVIAKRCGGLADALEQRDAAEEIVRWINREQDGSPETNKDYRVAFRMFGELATDGDEKPDSIEWVPGGYPSTYDPAPDPAKMFRWEDHIQPMLDVCRNARDRALIALAWDLGPRPGELFDLTVGSVADHKYGKQVTLTEGKQGTRSPIIVPSGPWVQEWLRDHPAPDDPEAPLWSKLSTAEGITNNRVRDIFKEKAEAAEMTPPSKATPSRMRKSSASHLASQSVSQAHLEDHHGWRRGSKVASRYIAVFGDANDREIARVHGVEIDVEDENTPIAPVPCPRCGRDTPRDEETCMWCDAALSTGAIHRIREETREVRADLLRVVQDNPELLADLESTEQLIQLVDDRPETIDDARALLEAIGD